MVFAGFDQQVANSGDMLLDYTRVCTHNQNLTIQGRILLNLKRESGKAHKAKLKTALTWISKEWLLTKEISYPVMADIVL